LVIPAELAIDFEGILRDLDADQVDPQTYETVRIEAGIPAVGHELSEEFTPLEAGLRAAISGEKGCYTGQEIIARQITYDKVTQNLSGLRLSGPSGPGAAIWADDRPAGVITSYAYSPRVGHIALAILKRPHHQPGLSVTVKNEDHILDAVVTQLPFISPDG
jgi:tRNA-modifying protein YgfZ